MAEASDQQVSDSAGVKGKPNAVQQVRLGGAQGSGLRAADQCAVLVLQHSSAAVPAHVASAGPTPPTVSDATH